jgi:hypothetical protein
MAFALWPRQITCPNCTFDGKAKAKGTGCGLWLLFGVLVLLSFAFWPLFIAAGPMFLWLLLKPADQICPRCKFANPVPKAG